MELDVEAARAAVQTIADAMGLDSVEQAAEGILAIVNENMAGALRLVSVQRGHDPRDFALVAYGGAGPLHANALAKLMGSFPVIVPPAPGLLCAIGDLVADFRDEFAQTYIRLVSATRAGDEVAGILDGLGEQATGLARRRGDRRGRAADRLHGGHALPPAGLRDPGRARPGRGARRRARRPRGAVQRAARAALRLPHAGHRVARSSTCARSATAPCRSRSCRSASVGSPDASAAVVDEHEVVFDGERVRDEDLRPREARARRRCSTGPAIVTEFDSTTVVLPGLPRRGRLELQHPDHPQRLSEGEMAVTEELADRRDPGRRGRPGHPRHHRGRAEERPLRDGRRALPLGDEPGHPRAARRVPDDHRPARPHGRRASSAPTSTR